MCPTPRVNKKELCGGFTLIEILVVIAIISVLLGSVLVGLGPAQRQGRDTRRISDLRQTQNALELYYSKCGFYPGTANCAATTIPTTWADLSSVLTGSGLGVTQIPNDPNTAKTYIYGSTDGSSYVLAADLEQSTNPALQSSPKGASVQGVDCSVANRYCVQF